MFPYVFFRRASSGSVLDCRPTGPGFDPEFPSIDVCLFTVSILSVQD